MQFSLRRRAKSRLSPASGFTIVEVLVVMPIAILIIGAIVAFIVILTGDAIYKYEDNAATFSVEDSNDTIEITAINATSFPTTYPDVSPSYSTLNNDVAANKYDTLIIEGVATSDSLYNPDREMIYKRPTGGTCGSSAPLYDPLYYYVIFYVSGGQLLQRTAVESYANLCKGTSTDTAVVYQQSTGPSPMVNDSVLANNVDSFQVSRLNKAGTPIAATTPNSSDSGKAYGVTFTITYKKMIAGKTATYSTTTTARSINTQYYNL